MVWGLGRKRGVRLHAEVTLALSGQEEGEEGFHFSSLKEESLGRVQEADQKLMGHMADVGEARQS